MRREAFVRWPVHGNVLEALREGRLELGPGALLEPDVWITAPGRARVRIGAGTFLNLGVMIAAAGAGGDRRPLHARQRLLRLRREPPLRRPEKPITWQGFESKGPTRIGDNCWLGANVVVTSGVTIGERCVIGANSVVTKDIEPFSIAAGVPARVLRKIEYGPREGDPTGA
jgi:acetyltransferase-like isoleucine patch superfamily enzyme